MCTDKDQVELVDLKLCNKARHVSLAKLNRLHIVPGNAAQQRDAKIIASRDYMLVRVQVVHRFNRVSPSSVYLHEEHDIRVLLAEKCQHRLLLRIMAKNVERYDSQLASTCARTICCWPINRHHSGQID